jgi:FK506-binding protein 1
LIRRRTSAFIFPASRALQTASDFLSMGPAELEKKRSYFDLEDETAPGLPSKLDGDLLGDGGVVKTILREGAGEVVTAGAEVTLNYEGRVKEGGMVLCRGEGYTFLQGDGTLIGGFETAVGSMRVGEKARVEIAPFYAYGGKGVPPVVRPDTVLEFDIEVVEAVGNFFNPRNYKDIDPKKLREAGKISQDYQRRSELRMKNDEGLEGFDKTLAWFKSLYFFGFFEGATGERPPWYLTPTITFPVMFGITLAAFYVLFVNGGVTIKRDMVSRDELELGAAFLNQVFG